MHTWMQAQQTQPLPFAMQTRRAAALSNGASPSVLLAVSRDLPENMARQTWSLHDYVILQKMYTGATSDASAGWSGQAWLSLMPCL